MRLMKKRLAILALFLMIGGAVLIISSVLTSLQISADSVTIQSVASSTWQSFLIFGGVMIGAAIILFIVLANL